MPFDWQNLCKTILSGGGYLTWKAAYIEHHFSRLLQEDYAFPFCLPHLYRGEEKATEGLMVRVAYHASNSSGTSDYRCQCRYKSTYWVQAAFTVTQVESLQRYCMTPFDWQNLCKAVLSEGGYLTWKGAYVEHAVGLIPLDSPLPSTLMRSLPLSLNYGCC